MMAEKTHYLKMLQSHLASRTAAAFQWRSAKDLKGIGGQTFISDGKTERKKRYRQLVVNREGDPSVHFRT